MTKAKVAVVGFGKMGMLHGGILNSLDNCELVGVCEPNSTIRNGFKEFMPKTPFYKDTKTLFKEQKLDAVFITTPPLSHVDLAIECIENDAAFFIEKPLSINAQLTEPLRQKLDQNYVINMIGYMMRFIPTFKKAKEVIQKEQLGKVISYNARTAVSQLFKKGTGWRYSKKDSGGGVLITQGVHLVDLLNWYFETPDSVSTLTHHKYSGEVEDFCLSNLKHKNNVIGQLNSSWSVDNRRLLETEIEIITDKGTVLVNQDYVKVYAREGTKEFKLGWTVFNITELFEPAIIDIGGTHFTNQDQFFINSVINKEKVDNDVYSSYRLHKTIDAMYFSAQADGEKKIVQI